MRVHHSHHDTILYYSHCHVKKTVFARELESHSKLFTVRIVGIESVRGISKIIMERVLPEVVRTGIERMIEWAYSFEPYFAPTVVLGECFLMLGWR